MYLLNSKSILDCLTEKEEENHRSEIEDLMEKISMIPNYKLILRYHFVDEAHQRNVDMFLHSNLHEFLESIDGIDCKNGYDFAVKDNDTLTVIVYGQNYLLNSMFYTVETHVDVLPFNEKGEFVNIFSSLGIIV